MFFHLLLNSTFLFQLDNLLRCDASTEDQLKNVTVTDDLGECLKGSFYCQVVYLFILFILFIFVYFLK